VRYRVTHRTEYSYPRTIGRGYNEAHLAPRATRYQQVRDHRVDIHPMPAYRSRRTDYFGNGVLHFAIQQPHSLLSVTAISVVELTSPAASITLAEGTPWETAGAIISDDRSNSGLEARQFLLDSPLVETRRALAQYAAPSFPAGRPVPAAVSDLMGRIHADFAYDPTATTISTPLERVFRERRGVCQDFAHLAIACLRSLRLPARYVSGYVETTAPPGQSRLVGADASHAWFAVYDPALGWLDYDPTNNRMPGTQHVTTAWGRDYGDVSPLKGVIFGGSQGQRSEVAVDVEPLDAEEHNRS